MTPTTFIYALCEPGTRTIRYIGKANDPTARRREHLLVSATLNTHLGHWISSLKVVGAVPELVTLREVPLESWKEEEVRYIRAARMLGMSLVNGTDGGEGCFNPTPETRAKMSASSRGRKIPESAIVASHTPEANAKRSAAMKGRKRSPEHCASISAGKSGTKCIPRTPEHRAALSAALKGRAPCAETILAAKSPEALAKRSASMKGRIYTPEHRANISASKKTAAASKRLKIIHFLLLTSYFSRYAPSCGSIP